MNRINDLRTRREDRIEGSIPDSHQACQLLYLNPVSRLRFPGIETWEGGKEGEKEGEGGGKSGPSPARKGDEGRDEGRDPTCPGACPQGNTGGRGDGTAT